MNVLLRSIVLFWTVSLVVASTCFGADIHYCEGEVQSFSLYSKAEPCKTKKEIIEQEVPKCCKARKIAEQQPSKGYPVVKNGNCCHNDQVAFKNDGENHYSEIQLPTLLKTVSQTFVHSDSFQNGLLVEPDKIHFRGPPDPKVVSDYQVFFQVFII